MGCWRGCLMCLVASAALTVLSAAASQGRFLKSVIREANTQESIPSEAALAAEGKKRFAEVKKPQANGRRALTIIRNVPEGETDREEDAEKRDATGMKKLVDNVGKNQIRTRRETTSHLEATKNRKGEDEEHTDEASEQERISQWLQWFLGPSSPGYSSQIVSAALANSRIATLPPYASFVGFSNVPTTAPFPTTADLAPWESSLLSALADNRGHHPGLGGFFTEGYPLRQVGARPALQSLQAIAMGSWFKAVADSLSDGIYEWYLQHQAEPADSATTGDASAPSQRGERINPVSFREEEIELRSEPKNDDYPSPGGNLLPVGTEQPDAPSNTRKYDLTVPNSHLKPLPAFKMNKSMRPYITTPVPFSPFYLFDKPPHFFPFTERGTTKPTLSAAKPIADWLGSDD